MTSNGDRRRDESFDWICHELRKPLAAIRAYAELLGDQLSGELNDEQLEEVATVLRNADRLDGMLDDLYELGEAALGGRRPAFAELDLEPLCAEVQDAVAPSFTRAGVRLDLLTPGPVAAATSSDHLRTALTRALRFALAGSERGDGVRVRLVPDRERVSISIEVERGDADALERDARARFSAPARRGNTELGGLGVDLRICAASAAAIGGSLQIRDRALGGVRLTVEIPRSAPPAGARTSSTPEDTDSHAWHETRGTRTSTS